MPGPNDYHVTMVEVTAEDGTKKKVPTIEPGLGADEPSPEMRAGARAAAAKALQEKEALLKSIQDDLKTQGTSLDERRRDLEERERQLAAREAALQAVLDKADADERAGQ